MRKSDLEVVKLSAREIILSLFDLTTPFYEASSIYRKSIRKYLESRSVDRANFLTKVRYLKQEGYIETFVEQKEKFVELTDKGKNYSRVILLENISISRPQKWDGKWRVVMFDIPEDSHSKRDRFRDQLHRLKFIQVQKSVYIYPFECAKEIALLSESLGISKYVTIMISEIIQGEKLIIKKFLDEEILNQKDLRKR